MKLKSTLSIVVLVITSGSLLTGCASLKQNMATSRK